MRVLGKIFLLFTFLPFFLDGQIPQVVTPHAHAGAKLTENKGQWEPNILFCAQLDGGALFLENNKLVFNFYDKKRFREYHRREIKKQLSKKEKIRGHAYEVEFLNALPQPQIEKMQMGSDYENFFIGNNPNKWKSNVRNYRQVWLKNIYSGIDYEIFTGINGLKYNFHVNPGANPSDIKLKYNGLAQLRLKDSALIIKLEVNEVIEQKPYAYQLIKNKVVTVPCVYKLSGNTLSYEFPNGYNKNYPLVIDPILVFSAQIGTTPDNFGMTATYDGQGNLYSGGMVFNVGYPTSVGAYDVTFNNVAGYGRTDVFVTKYNSTGNNLIYSTYLGGSGTEVASSMIVDNNNNLCLYGATSSTDFPTTPNAAYGSFSGGTTIGFTSNGSIFCGGTDIFITKFNAAGTGLIGSTYFGGSQNDGVNYLTNTYMDFVAANNNPCITNFPSTNYDSLQTNYGDQFRGEIQVDALNNIYIVSSTRSSNIPIVGGFDNTYNGGQDIIVAKFNANLSSLIFSSFYGGTHNDCGNGIYVDKNQFVYITGGTCSNNLPGTGTGHQNSYQGGKTDGFLCKINPSGNAIVNATYIGTNDYDVSFFVSGDKYGRIYVFGQSYGNMPVQASPTSTSGIYSVPNTHQFVRAYNNSLNSIFFSTVFGSKLVGVDISPSAFAVDNCNNIYLSGWGGGIITNTVAMNNMPIANAIPGFSTTTGYDFYLMALDSNATGLLFGSYFGGPTSDEHVDGGTSRFDPSGKIYQSVCAGCGGADDFPISPGAWPCGITTACPPGPNLSFNCNNGVFKIDFQLNTAVSAISSNTIMGCTPLTVSFTSVYTPTNPAATFTWNYGNGQTNTMVTNPVYTYTTPGTYTVSLIIFDPSSCNLKDSSTTFITVLPVPNPAFTASLAPCTNTVFITNNSTGTLSANPYVWNFGDGSPTVTATSPTHVYNNSGNYTISLLVTGANGCISSTTQTVNIFNFNPSVTNGVICEGLGITLTASGGTSYTWQPSTGLSATNIPSPTAGPSVTTLYSVTIENTTPGYPCVQTLTTLVTVHPKPTADFYYAINPCGGAVQFNDNSAANIAAWEWTLSPTQTSTVQNPYLFYSSGGDFTVTLIATNSFGCKDTVNKPISVPPPPPLSVNGNSFICKGNTAQLMAGGGVSYTWSPAQTLDSPNNQYPIASPSITTVYSVAITTSNNCQFTLVTTVNVYNLSNNPISAVANPTGVIQGNTTSLQYSGDPGATINWYPNTHVTPKTGYTVTAQPDRPTTYTVVAVNGSCRETLYVFVDVFLPGCIEGDAFVPNTFTPNGDGQNDILYVRGLKIDELYFAVYNRWGEMVFETTDKNKGWDGNYKGRPADVGVFGWYLKVKCYNGEETFKKGNVTLIR